jgi:outer membrane protein assembly factor BamB
MVAVPRPQRPGIVPDSDYPIEFGPSRNLKWRAAVRPGKSSLVLSRRHVFLTAYDQGALYTQCFDRGTGRLLWERRETPARHDYANGLNEPAASTPVTDGENVYVFFRDFGVVSYDRSGAVRWKKPMGPFANREGASVSPIIAASSLILVLDQLEGPEIVALSLVTGAVKWRVPRLERTEASTTPVLYAAPGQSVQIVTAGSGLFGGHAAESGDRLWTYPGVAPTMVASPVVTGNTVVGFGYGFDPMPPFAEVLARSDTDGDGRLSIAESGKDGWLKGIANFYGNRDGFIVESEWLGANAHAHRRGAPAVLRQSKTPATGRAATGMDRK